MKLKRKEFSAKKGKYTIITHESDDELGIIVDKFNKKGELVDTITVWYMDLSG
jgi:hypothetical protein